MQRIEEDGNYVAWYSKWKFTIMPLLIDPDTREYRVYVWNPNLYFPDTDCEAPEDFESLDAAKSRVSGFINENF